MHRYLVDQADTRGAQRLLRAAQPHACGFITAVPSDEDGKETLLRPRNFQIAVAESLSWIMRSPALCAKKAAPSMYLVIMPCHLLQGKEMLLFGNLIDSIGTDALLSPVIDVVVTKQI